MNKATYKTLALLILMVLSAALPAAAAPRELKPAAGYEVRQDTLRSKVYFRVGKSAVDRRFRDNAETVSDLTSRLRALCADTNTVITRINVRAGTSPEGNTAMNKRLSQRRVNSIVKLLKVILGRDGAGIDITREAIGIDWQGLHDLAAECGEEWAEEAAAIVDTVPEWIVRDRRVVDGRKRRLMMLRNGAAWFWMRDHLFAELRGSGSSVTIEYIHIVPSEREVVAPAPEFTPLKPDSAEIVAELLPQKIEKRELPPAPPSVTLNTNLVADAALIPNVGVELRLPSQWAFRLSGNFAWWSSDERHRFYRTWDITAEALRYFPRLSGKAHHVGVYAKAFTYDFEFGDRGRIARRPVWSAGVSYGYFIPLRWNLGLDLFVSAGWAGGKYEKYYPDRGCYVWLSTHKFNYFGPTDFGVRLVWKPGKKPKTRYAGKERRWGIW